MPMPSRRSRPVVLLAMVALLFSAFAAPVTAKPPADKSPIGSAEKVVMFASDGMRPDLMQKYAADGSMPTYKALMEQGVTGSNGMLQAFPPNTGVGWLTMATGAYPADHGSTNNTYFRAGDAFTNRTSFSAPGVVQADTIADAAERAGKKVAQIDWVAGAASGSVGPVVDFTNFFTNRGVLVGEADRGRAGRLGVLRRQLRRTRPWHRPPAGPTCPPATRPRRRWRRPGRRLELRRPEPEPLVQRLLLRQRRRWRRGVRPRHRQPRRQDRRSAVGRPRGRRLRGHQADGRERPDRRRAPARPPATTSSSSRSPGRQPVQAVSHVADSGHRALRRRLRRPAGRRRGRGPAREVHRRQPAAMGGRRLRPARGGRHRRGYVRRAGPRSRADLQPRRDQLHPRHPPAGHRPGDGRLPVHR